MHDKNLVTIGQAAKILKLSKDTLRRWEKKKIIRPFRSPSGWRYYDLKQLEYVFSQKPDFDSSIPNLSVKDEIIAPIIDSTKKKESVSKPISLNKNISNKKNLLIYALFFFVSINFILIIFYLLVSR